MKTKAKKKHPPSAKLLAHLKRLNMSRRKKKPAAKAKPAKKAAAPKKRSKPQAPKPAPAPKPVAPPIPPVELPKTEPAGQTTMPVVEAAVAACGCGEHKPEAAPAAAPGEELL